MTRLDIDDDGTRLTRFSSCELPTEFGEFRVDVYQVGPDEEHMLVYAGELSGHEPLFVRVHSECYTGEVLGSLRCDCRAQLRAAMQQIGELGRGAIVYLRQEGRGIGLGNKIRAYAEQDKGADTIEANERLGFAADLREYAIAAKILKLNSVREIVLNTNNPKKILALRQHGIAVAEVVPSVTPANPHNVRYLRTKREDLGHHGLGSLDQDSGIGSA